MKKELNNTLIKIFRPQGNIQVGDVKFGDHCSIEQKRFNIENEMYTHKIIGTLRSNCYVDVPVQLPQKETIHDEIEDVVACITCSIEERNVYRYRLKDIKISINPSLSEVLEKLENVSYKLISSMKSGFIKIIIVINKEGESWEHNWKKVYWQLRKDGKDCGLLDQSDLTIDSIKEIIE